MRKKDVKRMSFRKREETQSSDRKRRFVSLSALVTYLSIVALMTIGVTFSSYVTSVSGGDSARVAKFEVELTGAESLGIDASSAADGAREVFETYAFSVINHSEVKVDYTFVVHTETAMPEGVSLSIENETPEVHLTDEQTMEFPFSGGTLAPGEQAEHKLKITAMVDTLMSDITEQVSIDVTAVQAD